MEEKEEQRTAKTRAEQNYESILRRKRINFYKNCIVVMICVIAVLPSVFSMVLLYQVSGLEREVQYLNQQKVVGSQKKLSKVEQTQGEKVSAVGEKETTDANAVSGKDTQQKKAEKKRVYLTFDDGPSKNTDEILDILKKNHVKATFFVTAQTDANAKAAYKRIVAEGHTIGVHSYTHDYQQIYASREAFAKDVTQMADMIYKATGVRTHLYRFPGGSANRVCATSMNQLIKWLNDEGYIYYDWNSLSGDAVTKDLAPCTLVANVMDGVHKSAGNTSIVLMHDLATRHNTVESLEPLIRQLKQEGYALNRPITEKVAPIQQKKYSEK